LHAASIPIEADDDIATLHRKANAAFPALLCEVLAVSAAAGSIPSGQVQDECGSRYWLQRSDADGMIRWSTMTALQVHNLVRGITRPYPGAWSGSIRIWRTQLDCATVCGPPGRVAYIQGVGPYVCCTDRAILVSEASGPELRHGMHLER